MPQIRLDSQFYSGSGMIYGFAFQNFTFMKKIYIFAGALLFTGMSNAQQLDYGDAPEGALAYPQTGTIGMFPTCVSVGPNSWIHHANFGAFFLPAVDFEADGNGGLCPQFAPYDADECFMDGDAGLVIPEPYTISSLAPLVILCPNSRGTSLGLTCTQAVWGQNVDIRVVNNMPNNTTGYVNVLFDWDLNGFWAGAMPCPGGQLAPEHVLVNFPVPNGFAGLLSTLNPGPFLIGPNPGFVWARFTITEIPVPLPWTGSGFFEDGETEDYLIYIGEYDLGDAPENALAYPASGVMGNFPTCINVGAPGTFVRHAAGPALFGPMSDRENEGNAAVCPAFNPNQYDRDECFADGDAGLLLPGAYTIAGIVGNEQVVPCIGGGTRLDTVCRLAQWGTDIDINVTGPGFVNVLMDWNQDGNWAFNAATMCQGVSVPEHVLADFPVPQGFSGPLSALNPPAFRVGPNSGFVWSRFTISDIQVANPNWNGAGDFSFGETEDYLLDVVSGTIGVYEPGNGDEGIPFRIWPNPANDAVQIEFVLFRSENIRIEMLLPDGRLIAVLQDEQLPQGTQNIGIDLNSTGAGNLPDGLYLVRLRSSNGSVSYQRLGLMR